MGSCCCCLPRAETHGTPIYTYCPQTSAEQEHLSLSRSTSSAASSGVFVNTNLDTSIPDNYQASPVPSDSHLGLERSQTLQGNTGNNVNKNDHPSDSHPPEGLLDGDTFNSKSIENDSIKVNEDKQSELNITSSVVDEEDDCPICLEEYNFENPQIFTKCEHHFHLSCILEWMERSDTCPICDQIMNLDMEL